MQVAFGMQVGSRRALGGSQEGGGAYSAPWAPLGGFGMAFLSALDFGGVAGFVIFSERINIK